jgi:hypothetical protein
LQKTGFSGKKQKKHHQRRKTRVNSASSVPKPKTTRDDSRSALSCCAQARGKRIPRRTFGKSRIQPFAGTARFAKAYLDFCASIFIVQYIFFSPFLSIGKERCEQIYFEKREKTGRKLGFQPSSLQPTPSSLRMPGRGTETPANFFLIFAVFT